MPHRLDTDREAFEDYASRVRGWDVEGVESVTELVVHSASLTFRGAILVLEAGAAADIRASQSQPGGSANGETL